MQNLNIFYILLHQFIKYFYTLFIKNVFKDNLLIIYILKIFFYNIIKKKVKYFTKIIHMQNLNIFISIYKIFLYIINKKTYLKTIY